MEDSFDRAQRLTRQISLIGEEADRKLAESSVLVFGAGGVGGSAVEALARAGIGSITVVDFDRFSVSNLNRQLLCTVDTVGRPKAEVAKERILAVSPDCRAEGIDLFITAENAAEVILKIRPDFIVDAVDNITAKIAVIACAEENSIPVVSCMGTGNKLDCSAFRIEKIEKTSVCPLARVMRNELKKRGISGIPVLFSTEQPRQSGQRVPASISYVPQSAGLCLAGYVIRRLAGF